MKNMGLVLTYISAQIIIWKFGPPGSAWSDGWWERLIQVIKQLLK